MNKDEKLMQKCIELAEKGRLLSSPNPLVGAVVEKNGKIISTGYHKFFGGMHAEAIALKKAGKKSVGATLYVNLEPCCHFGKQPPCTAAIKNSGIKKVVIATIDPNPIVKGKGIKELKKHKIKIAAWVLEKEAQEINEKFFKYKKTGAPFVLVKNVVSANGVLAQKKISSRESLRKVHELRSEFDAILVGKNTVKKDNPLLTARIKGARNPIRVILDSKAELSLSANIFDKTAPTIIVCTKRASQEKIEKIIETGTGIVIAKEKNGKIDLHSLLKELGLAGISSVMVEGGAKVTESFLKEKLADRHIIAVSPTIIENGKNFWQVLKKANAQKNFRLSKISFFGQDAWIEFQPRL